MSNLGFRKAMEALDINLVQTKVGDRYVLEGLREHNASFGGEQSGHVIFLKDLVTGDGLLTAMRLVEVVAASGRRLADLRNDVITEYPQILRNVRVADAGRLEATDEICKEDAATIADELVAVVRANLT